MAKLQSYFVANIIFCVVTEKISYCSAYNPMVYWIQKTEVASFHQPLQLWPYLFLWVAWKWLQFGQQEAQTHFPYRLRSNNASILWYGYIFDFASDVILQFPAKYPKPSLPQKSFLEKEDSGDRSLA